jgi:PD-(D/E)XK nuclease superfamily protein
MLNITCEFFKIRTMARFVRTWTDEQLTKAVADTHSWRAATRALGMGSTSSYELIRRRVAELGLDTSHFRGKRSWTNEALAAAVARSKSWSAVGRRLKGGTNRESIDSMRELTRRMGLETSHLEGKRARQVHAVTDLPDQTFTRFGTEAEYLAAAWFTSRGYRVSLAAGGFPYDLIVDRRGEVQRVQVKSTTAAPTPSGTVLAKLSRLTPSRGAHTNRRNQCYEPADFDLFFVLTGEGHVFLIPLGDVAGMQSLMVGPESPYYVQTIGLSGR